jgi:glutamyl-Q tRNA(Asp) synthetase
MPRSRPVFRFAPSPNGYLHLGHAFSALFGFQMARKLGGRFLLRIEDIDRERSQPQFEQAIYEDLAWLGIEWDEPPRRQSKHFDAYQASLERLEALGVVYPCFASRRDITLAFTAKRGEAPCDPDGVPIYPGLYRYAPRELTAKRIAAGEPYALRLDMEKAVALAQSKLSGPIRFASFDESGPAGEHPTAPERWGDVVIARKGCPASYHLAVVTDDALQGVTHVTRGMDLYAATDIHRVLQILLGLPEPSYCHHRLIVDGEGRKLAKSHKDKSLKSLRAEGATPEAIQQMIGIFHDW